MIRTMKAASAPMSSLECIDGCAGRRQDIDIPYRSANDVVTRAAAYVQRSILFFGRVLSTRASAVGLVVKYLVANEMPRVRFPDGAYFCLALALASFRFD